MKRIKTLEYSWILKSSFYVNAYTIEHNNGKKYVVYAHDYNDMESFLVKLDLFQGGRTIYAKDCFDHFEKRDIKSYLLDKNGEPKKKPFWYRGRVYELETND